MGARMGGGAGPTHYWLLSHPTAVRSGGIYFSFIYLSAPCPKKTLLTCYSLLKRYQAQLLTGNNFFLILLSEVSGASENLSFDSIFSGMYFYRNVKPLAESMVENQGGVINTKKHLFLPSSKALQLFIYPDLDCLPYLL